MQRGRESLWKNMEQENENVDSILTRIGSVAVYQLLMAASILHISPAV